MWKWADTRLRRSAGGGKRSGGAWRVHRACAVLLVITAAEMLCARAEAGGSWMRGSLYTAKRPTPPEQIVPSPGSGGSTDGGTLTVNAGSWQGAVVSPGNVLLLPGSPSFPLSLGSAVLQTGSSASNTEMFPSSGIQTGGITFVGSLTSLGGGILYLGSSPVSSSYGASLTTPLGAGSLSISPAYTSYSPGSGGVAFQLAGSPAEWSLMSLGGGTLSLGSSSVSAITDAFDITNLLTFAPGVVGDLPGTAVSDETFSPSVSTFSAVPEPGSLAAVGVGVILAGWLGRVRRRSSSLRE